jgi:hypothetical protein
MRTIMPEITPNLWTCTPDADPSLAGVPATIAGAPGGMWVLYFIEGSALEISPYQLVKLED